MTGSPAGSTWAGTHRFWAPRFIEATTIAEVQSAANKGSILDKISGIEAGGGTTMGPPMEAAFEALQQTRPSSST